MAEIDQAVGVTRTLGTVARVAQAVRAKVEQFARASQPPFFPDRPLTRGILIDVDADLRMEFPLNPESLQTALQANYNAAQPVGHSHPILQYTGTGALSLDFQLPLDSTVLRSGHRREDEFFDVTARVSFLHSLLYPLGQGNNFTRSRPPQALFVFGDLIRLRGFLMKVAVSWQHFAASPVPREHLQPERAVASVTFQEQLTRRLTSGEARSLGMVRTPLRPETVGPPFSASVGGVGVG